MASWLFDKVNDWVCHHVFTTLDCPFTNLNKQKRQNVKGYNESKSLYTNTYSIICPSTIEDGWRVRWRVIPT